MSTAAGKAPPRAPRALPLLGHGLHLLHDPLGFFTSVRELGDVVAFGIGPKTAYVVNRIDLVRRILVNEADRFYNGPLKQEGRVLFGDGLGTSEGAFHRRQRLLIQPAFQPARIARYKAVMQQVAVDRCASWQHGQRLELDQEMYAIGLRVVSQTLFSSTLSAEVADKFERNVAQAMAGIARRSLLPLGLLKRLPTPSNRRFIAAVGALNDAVNRVIADRRARGAEADDILSMLLSAREEDGSGMSDQQIHDEAMTLLLGGSETTSTTLSWLFHVLGTHPMIEQRVHAELDDALRDWDGGAQALRKLDYLSRVVQETLRLYPAGWLLNRVSLTEVELGDYRLPSGSMVFFSPYALHRDPAAFPDPERFDPDRWLDGPALATSRAALLPFGAGSRKCIGESYALAESVTVAAMIARRWRLAPVPGQPVRPKPTSVLVPSQLPMIALRRGSHTPSVCPFPHHVAHEK
jgi:cytochrome P450